MSNEEFMAFLDKLNLKIDDLQCVMSIFDIVDERFAGLYSKVDEADQRTLDAFMAGCDHFHTVHRQLQELVDQSYIRDKKDKKTR